MTRTIRTVFVALALLLTPLAAHAEIIRLQASQKVPQTVAKLIIFGIWLISFLLALPNVFFYKFVYVFDEVNGGKKPFCTTQKDVSQASTVDYYEDRVDYAEASAYQAYLEYQIEDDSSSTEQIQSEREANLSYYQSNSSWMQYDQVRAREGS